MVGFKQIISQYKNVNYMIFHSGYIAPGDINITIRNEMIGRVYSTKFLVVLIGRNWIGNSMYIISTKIIQMYWHYDKSEKNYQNHLY